MWTIDDITNYQFNRLLCEEEELMAGKVVKPWYKNNAQERVGFKMSICEIQTWRPSSVKQLSHTPYYKLHLCLLLLSDFCSRRCVSVRVVWRRGERNAMMYESRLISRTQLSLIDTWTVRRSWAYVSPDTVKNGWSALCWLNSRIDSSFSY